MDTITLRANDISCAHCAMTIKRELGALEGIEQAEVDVANKTIELRYVDGEALVRAKALLEEIGYPVGS